MVLAFAIRVARVTAAAVLIVIGVLLSIPGIPGPGLLIVLIGLLVLLPESRWLRKKYVHFKRRHPRIFHVVEQYRKRRRKRRGRARKV